MADTDEVIPTSPPLTEEQIREMVGGPVVVDKSSPLQVSSATNTSLNAMIEYYYVKIGNEIMGQNLYRLEGALSSTKSALDQLSTLQGYSNMIDVSGRGSFPFSFSASEQTIFYTVSVLVDTNNTTGATMQVESSKVLNDGESYIDGYNIISEQYYKPIDPYFSIARAGNSGIAITAKTSAELVGSALAAYESFKQQLMTSKSQLSLLIPQLSQITPKLADGSEDPTSLLAKVRTVYDQLPDGNLDSIRNWVLDGYNLHNTSDITKQGQIQQAISNAITAGESLNSSQNSAVRRYMFIFEQYYQSASSILTQLNQTITNISRKISGG